MCIVQDTALSHIYVIVAFILQTASMILTLEDFAETKSCGKIDWRLGRREGSLGKCG